MAQDKLPFEHIYNLGGLGRAGDEVAVTVCGEDLKRIAEWAKVRVIESFGATVSLNRLSATRFSYNAQLRTEIIQDCIVTLEPVHSVIEFKVHRDLRLSETRRQSVDNGSAVEPAKDDEDEREEISSLYYDLAGPLLEELVLAINPYPRMPGVAFSPPSDPQERPKSPFAALKILKKPG